VPVFSSGSWLRVSLRCSGVLFVCLRCLRCIPPWGIGLLPLLLFLFPPDARFFFEEPGFPCWSCFYVD
jgi:hypothetical protein